MRAANYVEMTTTSIAGTSGDGAVTCTAITNTPTFTLALGSGACLVRYVIEDTVNKKFEAGIGSVAANVLTRTGTGLKPQVTWDGTTWADNSPSALQFGSSPTSGNIKIRLSALAEAMAPVLPGANSTIAGDATWRDYPISNFVQWNTGGANGGVVANTEYYSYYRLDIAGVLTGAQIEVTVGSAGNMKWALYSIGADGLPSSKIVDFTTITTMSATGIKTDTAFSAVALKPGWYAVGLIFDSTPSIRSTGTGAVPPQRTPLGRRNGYGYGNTVSIASKSYATGLPATFASAGAAIVDNGGSALGVIWAGLRVVP